MLKRSGNGPARIDDYGDALPFNFNIRGELIGVFTFDTQAERCVITLTDRDLRDPERVGATILAQHPTVHVRVLY